MVPPLFDFDIPQPGQRKAAHGWAARQGKDTKDGTQTSWFNQKATTCQIQNTDIPWAGRHRAAHGRTAGPGGDGQHSTLTGLFAQEKTVPLPAQTMDE